MLLIHAPHDYHSRYSHYLAEILRLEGFADFDEADIATLDAVGLARHGLVILPRLTLTRTQAELMQQYVTSGGRLLSMMPDAQFVPHFGLAPTWCGIDGGWLHLDPSQPAVQGFCAEPAQIVVPAVGWALSEQANATILAHMRNGKDAVVDATQPAIAWCKLGAGEAILFAYDLPHAVARLRQGNPDHADLCFSGLDGIYRPSELFVGQMDVAQMLLPQADIHTAFLARCIEMLAPRPRLWYYPEADQCSVLIMTSDDDWSTVEQFEALLAGLRQRQATCTFYIVPETKISHSLMAQWAQEGHTFSVHPALEADIRSYLAKDEPQRTLVAEMLRANVARHLAEYGDPPRTIRQHAVRWLGYVEAARVLAGLGVAMELNYVSVHPFSVGYMAGSGRALPFVDVDGALIACYQQATMWTEEVLIHPSFVFSFKWTVERALQEVDQMIERAANQFYTPIAINSHPVSFATYSSPLIEGTWDRALAAGMPILSPDRWLAWTEARAGVRLTIDAGGCTVHSPKPIDALTLLVTDGVAIEAEQRSATLVQRWGRQYTAVTLHDLHAGELRRVSLQQHAREPARK
jgi:hypothetical protein